LRSKTKSILEVISAAERSLNNDPALSIKLMGNASGLVGYEKYIDQCEFILGSAHRNCGEWDSAITHFEKSMKLREKGKDRKLYARTLSALGKCYYYTAVPGKALKILLKALKLQDETGDEYEKCRTLIFIANVYEAFTGESKRAIKLYTEALKLSRKIKNRNFEASSLGGLSSVYYDLKKFQVAVNYLIEAESIYTALKNTYMLSQVYAELGRSYFELKQYEISSGYFNKLYRVALKLKNANVKCEALGGLALCSYLMGNTPLFNKYNRMLLKLFPKLEDKRNICDYYRMFAGVFYELGDLKMAFEYQKKYNEEYIKFRDQESEKQLKGLLLSFEKERAEKESELLKIKNLQLQKEIEAKSNELNNSANYIVQKNEFLNTIFNDINTYVKKTDIGRIHRDNMLNFLKMVESKNRLNREMVSFENRLNNLNLEFTKKLSRKYASLSPVELKICSMMKINLGTKEIAKLLFISPRTVETHRHHIIKKLKLPKSQNLLNFINTI
jgi:tetratricopeptide (TPR) repeat protein/DNA-binding CsgD family transcriptional regulator